MRYLAIDYGTKKTGLAVCDPSESIVSPLMGLVNAKDMVGTIVEIVRSENIEAIVVGMPLNMDGTQGGQAKIVIDFANELKKHTNIPVLFQDERLTSYAAEEKLAARELTRKKRRKRIDALAAAEILQAFLDSKNLPPQS
jgi:putative Holliday junction resolvase